MNSTLVDFEPRIFISTLARPKNGTPTAPAPRVVMDPKRSDVFTSMFSKLYPHQDLRLCPDNAPAAKMRCP